VAVAEEQDVAFGWADSLDHAVGAAAGFVDALAARRAIAPERPVRALLVDLRRREPFVLAVVQLDQVVGDGGLREARQLRRPPRA